jgi:Aromatic-ring hydroxylase, C-terminal
VRLLVPDGTVHDQVEGEVEPIHGGAGRQLSRVAVAEPYIGRVELFRSRSDGAGVSGALVRPDGFVAWASAGSAGDPAGLEAALTRWFGETID